MYCRTVKCQLPTNTHSYIHTLSRYHILRHTQAFKQRFQTHTHTHTYTHPHTHTHRHTHRHTQIECILSGVDMLMNKLLDPKAVADALLGHGGYTGA